MNRLQTIIRTAHAEILKHYPSAEIAPGYIHYQGIYEFHFYVGDNIDPYALQIDTNLRTEILKEF